MPPVAASTAGAVASGAAGLRVETASGIDAHRALGRDWDRLLGEQPLPNPLLASDWLRRTRSRASDTTIVLARRGGELVAGGAFRRARIGPVTVATWLGSARLPSVLAAEDEAGAAREVVEAMLGRCHLLWLPRVPACGPTLPALRAAAPWLRETPVEPPGYVVEVPPPRLDHARARAGYALRRAARKGVAARVCTSAHPGEIGSAFDRLAQLYAERWRGREREGSRHSDVATAPGRYRAVLPELAATGRARIVEVYEDAMLAASVLGLVSGRGALFHTTATRPGGALRGPGHVAMLGWVDAAAAAGAEVMYLGRGAGDPEGPKARIGAEVLPLSDVLAAASPRRQSALAALLGAKAMLSRIRPGGGA